MTRMWPVLLVTALVGACEARGELTRGVAADAAWPNEPERFVALTSQGWSRVPYPPGGPVGRLLERAQALLPAPAEPDHWSYLRRSSSKDDEIVRDDDAPFSPPDVLRIVFTPDMQRDHEPSVHFVGLPSRPAEVYAGWWMKTSPNWTCSPAGCGKLTFLFPEEKNGPGVIYSNLAGVNGAHYVNVATTWPSTGYRFWDPNVVRTPVYDDRWYRVEWYVKWASAAEAHDGVVRWWVNGALNGDYRNVPFPILRGFVEFQHAPTRQAPPPAEQYLFIDHTYVSLSSDSVSAR